MLVWRWRSVITTCVVLAAVFAAGAAVGFLLEHEPAPDDRHISISRPLQPPPGETLLAGEVVAVDGGSIELRTLSGVVRVGLASDAAIEELRRVAESHFEPGDVVNLGGEQGEFGLVVTGVVALEPAEGQEASR
ncbi:MAG: hypothetical protein F4X26_02170 [Chloroflexi bacterium]|nr:hypothetical protein [Chloroflexota bacterium]MYD64796.1 hypothetical protein [Chloroflexota bacterium]